jgi:hypothetical protein
VFAKHCAFIGRFPPRIDRMKIIVLCTLLAGSCLTAAETGSASGQIDALLAKDWKAAGIQPNKPASDEVFLRRVYLDVIGRIPTAAEAAAFLDSTGKDKRAKLIDHLLASDGYVHHFFNYWADILRAQSTGIGNDLAAHSYLNYIRESLQANKPYDQFVRELVTSQGDCMDTGAVGYYVRDRGMVLDNLSNTVRIFLGTRMECAQCHNHPFDKWTQMDFYKMAAFTHNMTATNHPSPSHDAVQKQIRADKDLDAETRDMMRRALTEAFRPLQSSTVVQNKGKMQLPQDYKYPDAKPKEVIQANVMFGKPVALTAESNTIGELGKWLASPENARFTNVIADRLWKKVFGLALIEPLDELRDDSVCANPELMKFLERQMIGLKYDMKAYLRMLLNTQAYQRECTPTDVAAGTVYHFPGPTFRRMTAEQMWDSMVTLVNPSPDQSNWTLREREHREVENRKRLAKLLDSTEPELLFAAAREVADKMKEQNKEFDGLRKELDEARKKEDKNKIADIQRRLGGSQRVLRETISKCFYDAAKKSGSEDIQKQLAEACGSGPMEMAVMNLMGTPSVSISEMPVSDSEMAAMRDEERTLGLKDSKSVKSYESYRKSLHQTWVRASELVSPAPRGHFLREFGQSDRDVIENSSDEASVPQALTIMNGQLVSQLSSGWAALSLALQRAPQADQKIDTIYLSLFSRRATAKEKAMLLQMLDASAGSKTVWEDIVLAAISTQQFCFIQ